MKKLFIFLVAISLFSSCSFNRLFLNPKKIASAEKPDTVINRGWKDTLIFRFAGNNYQPSIYDLKGKPVELNYSIESVFFKDSKGHRLNGWFLKPKNIVPQITLLQLHGNSGNVANQYRSLAPLLSKGFQVFLFDYSGYGFSEGEADQKNVFINAMAALDYIKTREDIKNTKLLIYGQSLGGHLAACVAAERQSDIDGTIIEGAFSSPKDVGAYFSRRASHMGFPARLIVRSNYSAKREIKKYHKPLLVIHSSEDRLIPLYMGKKIFSNGNMPKEFYEIQHCHICGPAYYPTEIAEKIKQMVKGGT